MKNLLVRRFLLEGKLSRHLIKRKKIRQNINRMVSTWLRHCRSILAFMKKEIKDTKREIGRKMLGKQLSSFYS